MPRESPNESLLFLENRILELDHATEFVATEEHPVRIHPQTVFVLVAPPPHRIEIFQSKPEWVEFRDNSRNRPVHGEPKSAAARSIPRLPFSHWEEVARRQRRRRRGVEDYARKPGASGDGFGFVGTGSHRHHGAVGDHPAVPTVGQGPSGKLHGNRTADFAPGFLAQPFSQTGRAVGVIGIDKVQYGAVLQEHGLKKEKGFHHHVHGRPVTRRRVVKVRIDLFVRTDEIILSNCSH